MAEWSRLQAEQQRFQIGSVPIGGKPGGRPTVLIGSIFYKGHGIVTSEERGEFDRAEAQKLIRCQEEFAQRTGNPCMLDVVASTALTMERFLEFAASATGLPLLIDGTTPAIRHSGLEFVRRSGLAN